MGNWPDEGQGDFNTGGSASLTAPLFKNAKVKTNYMLADHTKHLSFEFCVPPDFFSEAVRITVPYIIPVRYTLNYKKEVEVIGYTVKPGMAKHIVNWEGLEEQLLEAAKNNAQSYNPPGNWFLEGRSVPDEIATIA